MDLPREGTKQTCETCVCACGKKPKHVLLGGTIPTEHLHFPSFCAGILLFRQCKDPPNGRAFKRTVGGKSWINFLSILRCGIVPYVNNNVKCKSAYTACIHIYIYIYVYIVVTIVPPPPFPPQTKRKTQDEDFACLCSMFNLFWGLGTWQRTASQNPSESKTYLPASLGSSISARFCVLRWRRYGSVD